VFGGQATSLTMGGSAGRGKVEKSTSGIQSCGDSSAVFTRVSQSSYKRNQYSIANPLSFVARGLTVGE
jgi:hypothetical protein